MKIQCINSVFVLAAVLVAMPCKGEPKDYSGQDLQKSDFSNGALDRAKFDGCSLQFADFTNTTLKGASFQGANLENARFNRAVLDGADFTDANLQSATFTDAKAWNTNFAGAEICLAGVGGFDPEAMLQRGWTEERVRKVSEILRNASEVVGTVLPTNGKLSFHYANLRSSVIIGSAEGVDFRDADLRGANLMAVENLDKARLKGAKYDQDTRWRVNETEAGAVFVDNGRPMPGPLASSTFPFLGKWLIIKEADGAKDSGSLTFERDHSFEWLVGHNEDAPELVKGVWSEDGSGVVLKNGESGQTWSAIRDVRLHTPTILLKSGNGMTRTAGKDQ